jgi:hypothetical protein
VDDPVFMSGLERLGDLPDDWKGLVEWDWPCTIASARVGPSTSSITSAVVLPARSRP